MEKDTVLLSLKDYTDLVEFKREVLAGKFVGIDTSYEHHCVYYTVSELADKFKEALDEQQNKYQSLQNAIDNMFALKNKVIDEKKSIIQEKDALIKSLATMSFWEFYKFRKNNR